jgi:glycosyltransferase involved in cell wall biosynthesis
VEFLGVRDDVPELIAAADLLVHPSRTEALPTAPIEAGAAGLPVVATDVGGTREIVEEGITGYLVANGDARALADRILKILGDRELAMQMGKAAQERVGRMFNLEQQAERTAKLYEQVLASS